MKAYIRAIFAGSCISVIGNFLLIPILHTIGAAYSVVLAELMVLIVMLYEVKNELPIIKFFNIYFLNFFVMFIVVYTVGLVFNTSSILTTFAQILIGIIIYVFLTIIDVPWARDYAIRFFIKIKSRI
jgi:O-antigen/teichoic acid export membrane protein